MNNEFITFDEFQNVKNKMKDYLEKEYSEEAYATIIEASILVKEQKEKLDNLAKNYFGKDVVKTKEDMRASYFRIIEDCLRRIKEIQIEIDLESVSDKKNEI